MPHRRVLFEPQASRTLISGFNALADAMQVTLGPKGRLVGVAQDNPKKPPELLSDGAAIARRFTGFPNRFQTMGAFLARQIAWQVEESVGDGSTTAVVIARHILNHAARHVAAGHNPMRLRRGLERGLVAVEEGLRSLVRPLEDPAHIAALGTSVTGSPQLGQFLEELFDVVGPTGAIDVRGSYSRLHEREYIQGAYWKKGWASSHFVTEAGKAVLEHPYLLFTDSVLNDGQSLIPILEKIKAEGKNRGVVVLAVDVQSDALNLLITNKSRGVLPTLAIVAPGAGPEKTLILEDLATLCGGRVLYRHADDLTQITLQDLGQADRVEAIRSGFTVVGGKGRPALVRRRVQDLQAQMAKAKDPIARNRLQERAGKLMGGVAMLHVGGVTDVERDSGVERAKEAVQVIRLSLQNGVVPGGGAAYLACRERIDQLQLEGEEAAARPILYAALEAPMQAILHNAGYEPAPILNRVREAGGGMGFDVMQGQMTDMVAANIVDPLDVVIAAWRAGVSGALMALTTEVLVHLPRDNRDEAVKLNP